MQHTFIDRRHGKSNEHITEDQHLSFQASITREKARLVGFQGSNDGVKHQIDASSGSIKKHVRCV